MLFSRLLVPLIFRAHTVLKIFEKMRTYLLHWFATQQQVRTFRKQKCSEEFNELSFNLALTLSLPTET